MRSRDLSPQWVPEKMDSRRLRQMQDFQKLKFSLCLHLSCDQGFLLLLKLSSQLPRLGQRLAGIHYAVWLLKRNIFSALGQDCLETNHNLSSVKLLLGLGQPLLQPLQFCSSVSLNNGNDWWMVGGQEDIWYQDIWFGGVFDAWIFCVGIFDINRVDKLQSTFHMPRHFNSTHSFCRI